jgi:predicted signal transduction protein with EAL and GGDEF domain
VIALAGILETLHLSTPCVGFSNTPQVQSLLALQTISAVIDEGRYQQGYFAVQKAYEAILKKVEAGRLSGVEIPSTVVFSVNACCTGETLNDAFEMLVRQRTEILCSYKERLEQANAELVSLSITDPLTGLPNRRRFQEVIQQEAV